MPSKLKKLRVDRVDLVDKGANPGAHIVLFKRDAPSEEEPAEGGAVVPNETDDKTQDAVVAEKAALEGRVSELEKELASAISRAEAAEELAKSASDPEDVWKSVPLAIRKKFEEQEARIKLADEIAKRERDTRERQECIQKASSYQYLPVNPDDDWEVFKAINGLDTKISGRIYQLFSAGDTNLSKSVTTNERGFGGSGRSAESALDQIHHLVNDRVAKSNNQMSLNDAMAEVMQANPALYRAYTAEIAAYQKSSRGE